jgi:hypothetical protein
MDSVAVDRQAVLEAAESQRATHMDLGVGGATAVFFAATYPERVRSLILANFRSSYPELRGLTAPQLEKFARTLASTRGLRINNPRLAHDPVLQRAWGRARRLGNSPQTMARAMQMSAELDVESLLAHVRAPTLVLHRRDNHVWDIETSRAAAAAIANSQFVELPGSEADIFLGDTESVLAEVARFLAEPQTAAVTDRVSATVCSPTLSPRPNSSPHRATTPGVTSFDEHDKHTNRIVREYGGRTVRSTGDGTLATFDGPARAVRCAAAVLASATQQGISLRAGLHTGEIELRPPDIAGIAVRTASRIADLAGPNEILVSRTVVDLTAGSGLEFEPRGEHQLKGVPGTWPTFAAQTNRSLTAP